MTNDRALMGVFANRSPTRLIAWVPFFAVITAANLWLVWQTFSGN